MSIPKNQILRAIDIWVNPEQYSDDEDKGEFRDSPRIVLGENGLKLSELDQYLLTHTTLGEEPTPLSGGELEKPLSVEQRNSLGHRVLAKLFADCFPDRDNTTIRTVITMRR